MGVEAAVGPRRKLPAGPGTANPAHRFTQEVGGAELVAQPGHSPLNRYAGYGQSIGKAPVPAI